MVRDGQHGKGDAQASFSWGCSERSMRPLRNLAFLTSLPCEEAGGVFPAWSAVGKARAWPWPLKLTPHCGFHPWGMTMQLGLALVLGWPCAGVWPGLAARALPPSQCCGQCLPCAVGPLWRAPATRGPGHLSQPWPAFPRPECHHLLQEPARLLPLLWAKGHSSQWGHPQAVPLKYLASCPSDPPQPVAGLRWPGSPGLGGVVSTLGGELGPPPSLWGCLLGRLSLFPNLDPQTLRRPALALNRQCMH